MRIFLTISALLLSVSAFIMAQYGLKRIPKLFEEIKMLKEENLHLYDQLSKYQTKYAILEEESKKIKEDAEKYLNKYIAQRALINKEEK